MWHAFLATFLVLTVTEPLQQNIAPANVSALSPAISTRQTVFSVPFRVDQPAEPSQKPVEVQLLVSHDKGTHWQVYGRALPNQKQIPFRTATDGEYWFAVRTVDQAGKLRPETISAPGLRVIVDTTPPRLRLSAKCGPAGQINVQWQINELYPKPESFSIQYRTLPNGSWQTVAVAQKNSTVSDGEQTGEIAWWPQGGSGEIQIRAEVADSAGNKSVSHAQVKIEQPANRLNAADEQSGTKAGKINPPVANRYQTAGDFSTDPDLSKLPPGERPKMINTRMFELDYDLESVGPSGISRVELWGSRDGGRTWRLFTVDDDNRSPISVSVDEEGVYGFRIVAVSGAGLGEKPPKSGDLPSIWVGVDLTRPVARIVKAELGKGADDGQMNITWEASDKMLADRPITLAFAQNRAGPWTTIATGLENSGLYKWTIDSRTPPVIFLRLEARDEAGNLSIQEYGDPVALDQIRPSIKIREVRPVAKTGPKLQ